MHSQGQAGGDIGTERADAAADRAPGSSPAEEATDAALRLVGLTKRFPGAPTPAVDHLDLTMAPGELTALVGPSGCGKSTTLRMINRLIEPTEGEIYVQGVEVRAQPRHELRRRIGYVIQQIGLFPHRTVADNIATVPKLLGWKRAAIRERTAELAAQVGLDRDLLDR